MLASGYFWVCPCDGFNIFPDRYRLPGNRIGKYGSGIVASFPAQGGAFIFIGRPDKSLGDDDIGLQECILDIF